MCACREFQIEWQQPGKLGYMCSNVIDTVHIFSDDDDGVYMLCRKWRAYST